MADAVSQIPANTLITHHTTQHNTTHKAIRNITNITHLQAWKVKLSCLCLLEVCCAMKDEFRVADTPELVVEEKIPFACKQTVSIYYCDCNEIS